MSCLAPSDAFRSYAAGNDTIRGNGGNDTINGGANSDSIDAGAGNDVILISARDAISDTMAGELGTDTVKVTGTADAILTGTSQMTGIEIFDGSGLSLRGTDSANTFDFTAYTLTNLAGILRLTATIPCAGRPTPTSSTATTVPTLSTASWTATRSASPAQRRRPTRWPAAAAPTRCRSLARST